MIPHKEMNPNILVFSLFPGLQESVFKHIIDDPNLKGIVMRSYGSGNAPQQKWLTDMLTTAVERGVVIVNISQCVAGRVEMERYGAGLHLFKAGVLSGYDSTIEAATTKLMHLTALHNDPCVVTAHMKRCLAGEITLDS